MTVFTNSVIVQTEYHILLYMPALVVYSYGGYIKYFHRYNIIGAFMGSSLERIRAVACGSAGAQVVVYYPSCGQHAGNS
jgi:hypothetical protein